MDQKGVVWVPFLIGAIVLSIAAGLIVVKNQQTKPLPNKDTATVVESSNSAELIESPDPSPNDIETLSMPSSSPKQNCDVNKDLCFESMDLNVTIQEGYQEDLANTDKWVSDQVILSGKGNGGFELKLEGFPKEFSASSPVQDFTGSKQKIYVRAQKDKAPKGTYTGKISVKSYLTGKTQTANLQINYVNWNESAIRTEPKEVVMNCSVKFSGWEENRYMYCGKYDEDNIVTLYYLGDHKNIEVRSIPEEGSKRWLRLAVNNYSTTFDVRDSKRLYINTMNFPDNKGLGDEPSGTYKGYFQFIDQTTQKEFFRVPYTINFTGLK